MTQPVPCAGLWRLFDSTSLEDHDRAKKLCAVCPALASCRDLLAETRRTAYAPSYGPAGTWAGELVGVAKPEKRIASAATRAMEEKAYTDDDARIAHRRHMRGERSPWIETGERVYQRRKKQIVRANAKKAA